MAGQRRDTDLQAAVERAKARRRGLIEAKRAEFKERVRAPGASPAPTMSGPELRMRRQSLGLSQQALAERLDTTATTVARWERGELAIQRPRMLVLALDTLARELLDAAPKPFRVDHLVLGDWEPRESDFPTLERAVEYATARKRAELPKRWRVVDRRGRVVWTDEREPA